MSEWSRELHDLLGTGSWERLFETRMFSFPQEESLGFKGDVKR